MPTPYPLQQEAVQLQRELMEMQERISPVQMAAALLTDSQRLSLSYRNLVNALVAENGELTRENNTLRERLNAQMTGEEAPVDSGA